MAVEMIIDYWNPMAPPGHPLQPQKRPAHQSGLLIMHVVRRGRQRCTNDGATEPLCGPCRIRL